MPPSSSADKAASAVENGGVNVGSTILDSVPVLCGSCECVLDDVFAGVSVATDEVGSSHEFEPVFAVDCGEAVSPFHGWPRCGLCCHTPSIDARAPRSAAHGGSVGACVVF